MKVRDFGKVLLCGFIIFILIMVFSNDFIFSFGLGVASCFPFYWLKKAIIKHDTKIELDNIEEYYRIKNK